MSLPRCIFAPRQTLVYRADGPHDTRGMKQRPAILTGYHFTKVALATFSEGYEIVGHMDRPDLALVTLAHLQHHPASGVAAALDDHHPALARRRSPSTGTLRTMRCGGYHYAAASCRSAMRQIINRTERTAWVGF